MHRDGALHVDLARARLAPAQGRGVRHVEQVHERAGGRGTGVVAVERVEPELAAVGEEAQRLLAGDAQDRALEVGVARALHALERGAHDREPLPPCRGGLHGLIGRIRVDIACLSGLAEDGLDAVEPRADRLDRLGFQLEVMALARQQREALVARGAGAQAALQCGRLLATARGGEVSQPYSTVMSNE